MPFFLTNFPDKLSIYPKRMTAPPIVCKIGFIPFYVKVPMKRNFLFGTFVDKGLKFRFLLGGPNLKSMPFYIQL